MVRLILHSTVAARRRVGRRGAVLIILGGIYVIVGLSFIQFPTDDAHSAYDFAISLTDSLAFWGGSFVVVGAIACVAGFWPTGRDVWGYAALVAFTSIWAIFCFLSTLLDNSPRGWVLGFVWTGVASMLAIVSGMRGANE